MAAIHLQTTKKVVPMIYAYTTPEIARHRGWTKIGYTENDVDTRLSQQMHTADVHWNEEWRGTAIYEDGSGEPFRDTDFHTYLTKLGVERQKSTEWFRISGKESRYDFYEFRSNRGIAKTEDTVVSYQLRDEQEAAVKKAYDYFTGGKGTAFLFNAKPRFGKTLTVYDLCKKLNAVNVLIVTNRPAIANSWYSDYAHFLGTQSGYLFVSNTEALKNCPHVVTREQYIKMFHKNDQEEYKCIEFVSLQDLKGSSYFGGEYSKLGEVASINWDLLVIDEAHEGVDTYKTDVAFDQMSNGRLLSAQTVV